MRRAQIFAKERDADKASTFIDGDGFRLAGACFKDEARDAEAAGFVFEGGENRAPDTLPAGSGRDVHPFDFPDAWLGAADGPAADRLAGDVGQEEAAAALSDFVGIEPKEVRTVLRIA